MKKEKTVIDVINTQILNKSANYCPFPQNPKKIFKTNPVKGYLVRWIIALVTTIILETRYLCPIFIICKTNNYIHH